MCVGLAGLTRTKIAHPQIAFLVAEIPQKNFWNVVVSLGAQSSPFLMSHTTYFLWDKTGEGVAYLRFVIDGVHAHTIKRKEGNASCIYSDISQDRCGVKNISPVMRSIRSCGWFTYVCAHRKREFFGHLFRGIVRNYPESSVLRRGRSGAILEISRRISSISSFRPFAIMFRAVAWAVNKDDRNRWISSSVRGHSRRSRASIAN